MSYNEALDVPVVTLSLFGNVFEPEPSVPFSAFDCVRGNVEDPGIIKLPVYYKMYNYEKKYIRKN